MANYYNFNELKEKISLREVCEYYNIELHNEHNDIATASLRSGDKTPSASFNFADGTFFDYGDAELGGNIFNLVAWCEFGEKGVNRKLNSDMMMRVASVLGERYGIQPVNRSNRKSEVVSSEEWKPLSDNEYSAIGLHPQNMAQDMNIDVRKKSESELNRFMATRVGVAISDVAKSSRTEYILFLQSSTQPLLYQAKKDYLASILAIDNAMKNGVTDLTEFTERAKKLYNQLKYKCDLLARAYPPFEQRYTRLNEEEYKRLVSKFRAGTPEYELKKYQDSSSKQSIEIGVVSNAELKKKAKELNQQLYTIDTGISKEAYVDFLKGYKQLPDDKKFPFVAWDNKRPNAFKVRVMEKDLKTTATLLGIESQIISDKIEAGNKVLPYRSEKGRTAIGTQIRVAMAIHDETNADAARHIGVDSRRVSEALRGDNPKVEEKLCEHYGISRNVNHSATVIKSDTIAKRHFNELTAQEQLKVIESLAVLPENYKPDGTAFSLEEIRRKCVVENQKWIYDIDLQRTPDNAYVSVVKGNKHTVEYASLKGRAMFIEFKNATANNMKLLDDMVLAKFPFSSATKGDSLVVTIPRDRKEDFVRFALQNGANLSNANNKDIQAMASNLYYQPNKATETQSKTKPKMFTL